MKLTDVSSPRGAPMGRPSQTDSGEHDCWLLSVRLDEGGYDKGGAYWGLPQNNLWRCCDVETEGAKFEVFFRSASPASARAWLAREHPGVRLVPYCGSFDLEETLEAFLRCMLWTSTMTVDADDVDEVMIFEDEIGDTISLDEKFGVEDIAPPGVETARMLCAEFLVKNEKAVREYVDGGCNLAQLGHDLWLSSQGHGTGFWDRGLGELGDTLHAAAKAIGEVSVCVSAGVVLFD